MAAELRTLPEIAEFLEQVARHGATDEAYLRTHFPRMRRTIALLRESSMAGQGSTLLDLGAHWLHLSVLLANEGFEVTAADLPEVLATPAVRALAQKHHIQLQELGDLSLPASLANLPKDSFDVVVLAEVLEHLAFNPVPLWQEIRRVTRPGGLVVVTTPNYYSFSTRLRALGRFLTLRGGGLPVWKVLAHPTYSHHWKEYSARELREYVAGLGSGFEWHRLVYTGRGGRNPAPESWKQWVLWPVWQLLPLTRQDLHLELIVTDSADYADGSSSG